MSIAIKGFYCCDVEQYINVEHNIKYQSTSFSLDEFCAGSKSTAFPILMLKIGHAKSIE
jgi:hypothetical protein